MLSGITAVIAAALVAATLPAPTVDIAAPEDAQLVEIRAENCGFSQDAGEDATDYAGGQWDSEWDTQWDTQWDTSYYEPQCAEPAWEPAWEPGNGASEGLTADEFRWRGVVYGDDGTRYTWYSQNVLPGGGLEELNANGRHVEGGYVVDADGYIAVASSDHGMGEVLDTPFGPAKVYDTGCAGGTVDVYTDF